MELSARAEQGGILPSSINSIDFDFYLSSINSHNLVNFQNYQSFPDLLYLSGTRVSTVTMADALKAEGNKAFAEKKFDEAMYASNFTYVYLRLSDLI